MRAVSGRCGPFRAALPLCAAFYCLVCGFHRPLGGPVPCGLLVCASRGWRCAMRIGGVRVAWVALCHADCWCACRVGGAVPCALLVCVWRGWRCAVRIAGVRVAWVALCHADCWCVRRVGGAVPCGWLVCVSRAWRCAMRIAGVRVAWVALCHADCWCAGRVGGAVPCGWLVSVSRGWRCAMRIAGVRDCCRCQTACEGCASQEAAAEAVAQHRLGRGPLLLLGVCLCGTACPPGSRAAAARQRVKAVCVPRRCCRGCFGVGRGPLLLLGVCLCGPPRSPAWGAGGRSVSAWVACCRCQTACEGCASQDAAAVAVLELVAGRCFSSGCVSADRLARPHAARGGRSVSAWGTCCRCQTACEGCAVPRRCCRRCFAATAWVAGRCFSSGCVSAGHRARPHGAREDAACLPGSRAAAARQRVKAVPVPRRCCRSCFGVGRGPFLLFGVCPLRTASLAPMGRGRTQCVRLGRVLPLPDAPRRCCRGCFAAPPGSRGRCFSPACVSADHLARPHGAREDAACPPGSRAAAARQRVKAVRPKTLLP